MNMLWRAIPRALASTAPHGCRAATKGARVVDKWDGVHCGSMGKEQRTRGGEMNFRP
jgi:hypothetical protein